MEENELSSNTDDIIEIQEKSEPEEEAAGTVERVPRFRDWYTYVATHNRLLDHETGEFMQVGAVQRLYRHMLPERERARDFLLEGPHSVTKADSVCFEPNRPRYIKDGNRRKVNLWTPVTLTPVKGDVQPYLGLLEHIYDGDETAIDYILNVVAHLVQKPGQKLRAAIILTGRQGTGKSMFTNTIRKLVGEKNSNTLSPLDLGGSFNGWIDRSLLTVVEEMTRDDRKTTSARMKSWITDDYVMVNRKGIQQYKVRNHTFFIVISNEPDPLVLDADDRRYFVWNSQAERKEPSYYKGLSDWLEQSGYAHIMHFLMERDLSGFSPFEAPPATRGREELIHRGRSDAEAFFHEAYEAVDAPFDRDLVVVREVQDAVRHLTGLRTRPKQVAAFLKAINAQPLGQKRVGTEKLRIWAIRNGERWANATEGEIAAEYLDHLGGEEPAVMR